MQRFTEQCSTEAIERADESLRAITAIADLGLASLDAEALPDALAGIRRLARDAGRDLQAIESALIATHAPEPGASECSRPGIDRRGRDAAERA